jgi:hypothetical protein
MAIRIFTTIKFHTLEQPEGIDVLNLLLFELSIQLDDFWP